MESSAAGVLVAVAPVSSYLPWLEDGLSLTNSSRSSLATPAGCLRLVWSSWEECTVPPPQSYSHHLTPAHLTVSTCKIRQSEEKVTNYWEVGHLYLGYLCCSIACAIQLEKSVIITGGGNSDYCTTGQNSGSEKRVEQYNLDGSMGSLPYLNTGRAYHACGKYVQDGEVVSIPTLSHL